MAMPKATMDKNDLATTWKNEIGTPRQMSAVQAVAISNSMDQAPHKHLGTRIFALNLRHTVGTLRWRKIVTHRQPVRTREKLSPFAFREQLGCVWVVESRLLQRPLAASDKAL